MKRQIRSSVFETNSSSVHSLTIAPNGRKRNRIHIDNEGYLAAHFGSFGCSGKFFSQSEKLSYLVTSLWYAVGCPEYLDDLYRSYAWEHLEDAVKEYVPECKGVRIRDYHYRDDDYEAAPYIDHQSVPDSEWDMIIDMYDKDAVIDFIWNDNVGLKCCRD